MIEVSKVERIAELAKLSLSEEELGGFAREFGRMVEMVESLQEVDTEFVEPTYHGNQLKNVFREDIPLKSDKVEALIANAPASHDGFIQVPVILESEED